jgi:hypothetical protein
MKNFLFLLLFCQISLAQKLSKDNLLNKMSDEICTEMKTKKIDKSNFEMTLGIVMMKSINNNKQNVEKFYGNKMYGENGVIEKIGEDLGSVMITRCPDMFEKLNDIGALENYYDDIEKEELVEVDSAEVVDENFQTITGNYTGTTSEGFYTIQITESNGKTNKIILLDKFDNSFLITDKVLKLSDKIKISFYEAELFDSKLNLFVNTKIITDIQKI